MASRALWLVGASLLTAPASAQFDFGPPSGYSSQDPKPWASLKLNTKTTVKLSFRNASVESVLSFYERVSKVTIVNDPSLNGTITLTSATPVTLSKCFQILSSKLDMMGYTMSRDDDMLIIKKKPTTGRGNAAAGGMSGMPGGMSATTSGGPGGMGGAQSQNILKVYSIKFASATEIARVLNEVFSMQQQGGTGATGTMSGFPGGGGMMPGGGGPGGGQGGPGGGGPGGAPPGGGQMGPNAGTDTSDLVADTQGGGGQGGPGGAGRTMGGGFPGGMQAMQGGRGTSSSTTVAKASAETFTNSVLVYAPTSIHTQVESLLKELDRPSETNLESRFFKLQYADASTTATSITNLLNANATTGRGSTSSTSSSQSRGGFGFFGGSSSQNTSTVSADTRINAILVTATPANMKLVERLLPEMDMPVKISTTTFVFPLANARASDVATLLTSAYGQRSGTSRSSTSTSSTSRTSSSSSSTTNRNQNSGSGGLGGDIGSGVDLSLQDPSAASGELMTNIAAQGFGGFGGQQSGGGSTSRTSSSTSTSTARDANGRVVNTQDLTNQVTVVADPNTNSVIVVTSPENADLIRNVLDQLDRIPQQVMIETIIVEATLDSSSKFGFEWNWANGKALGIKGLSGTASSGFGQSTTSQGFSYTLSSSNFDGFLNMLNQDQRFHVLSTPKIFTSNNVNAEINISQSIPYVTNSRQNTDGTFSYNYSFEDVGIVLSVTPHITANGYVTMDVTQTANELQGYTDFNAPIINQREAGTTVSVQDGETIILGGIIRSSVSSTVKKLPVLGDLPLLGSMFRSTSKDKSQTELLVFLRPRVVTSPEDARKLSEEARKNMGQSLRKDFDRAANSGSDKPATNGGKTGGE